MPETETIPNQWWVIGLLATIVVVLMLPELKFLFTRMRRLKLPGGIELDMAEPHGQDGGTSAKPWRDGGRYAVLRYAAVIFVLSIPLLANTLVARTRSTAEKLSALDSMGIPAFVVEIPATSSPLDEHDVAQLRVIAANSSATHFYNRSISSKTTLGQLIQSRRGARMEKKHVRDRFEHLVTSELVTNVNDKPAEIRLTCKFVENGEGFTITQIVAHQVWSTTESCGYIVAVLAINDHQVLPSDELADWASRAPIKSG